MKKSRDPLPTILFEDDVLVAFDKPSGLLVAPDRWDKEQEDLMRLVHERLSADYFNAHRLDRDTSGVLVCGKTAEAVRRLTELFESHQVAKEYAALTRGVPPEVRGVIDAPLAPDARQPGRMRVAGDGKPAETGYEVLERWGASYAHVRLTPQTGRTHQIRVHLAHVGAPVLADPLYGDGRGLFLSEFKRDYRRTAHEERPLIGRLALHAERLTFPHPATGQSLAIVSPVPKDFQVALKYLRRYAG
jgi:RluA family pseudouridine synthase